MTESDEATPPIVLVVMGVSGTGKSTVAGMLAGGSAGTWKKATTFTRPPTWPRWRQVSR